MATGPVTFSFYHINAEIHTTPCRACMASIIGVAVFVMDVPAVAMDIPVAATDYCNGRPYGCSQLLQWTSLWLRLTIAMDVPVTVTKY